MYVCNKVRVFLCHCNVLTSPSYIVLSSVSCICPHAATPKFAISFNPFFSKQKYKLLLTKKKRDPRICIIFVDMFISDKWLGGLNSSYTLSHLREQIQDVWRGFCTCKTPIAVIWCKILTLLTLSGLLETHHQLQGGLFYCFLRAGCILMMIQ